MFKCIDSVLYYGDLKSEVRFDSDNDLECETFANELLSDCFDYNVMSLNEIVHEFNSMISE